MNTLLWMSPSRTVARRLVSSRPLFGLAALLVVSATVGLLGLPAGALGHQDELGPCPADLNDLDASDTQVNIVKVQGLIDGVVADHVQDEFDEVADSFANGTESGAEIIGVVVWLNSKGSVLDDATYLDLATTIRDSPVPVAMWVGQSGAVAEGGAAELLGLADVVGVSAGSTIGKTGPKRLPSSFDTPFGANAALLEDETIGAAEAVELGISVGPLSDVATIAPFVTNIEGYEILRCFDAETSDETVGDDAVAVDGDDEASGPPSGLRTLSLTTNRFSGLGIVDQLFHTVASPEVAYIFFTMGLALLVFELFTAGVGVAGVVGAGFLILGTYGIAALPTRSIAIALLVLALLALAVDIQTNVPRIYTVVGLLAFTAGTLWLYDGVSMSWVTVIAGLIGAALYAYAGMPSMVRTRFSTPILGRKWLIGEVGQATTDVGPDGTVKIKDVPWRAINESTQVKSGETVRVTGIKRMMLEVERQPATPDTDNDDKN